MHASTTSHHIERYNVSYSFLRTITSLKEEEEIEQCVANINVSPLFSSFSETDTSSLYLLVVNARFDISKIDHHIILTDYHHNSHPRCHYLPLSLKLSFYLLFHVIHIRAISSVSKVDDTRINRIKYFTFKILI